VISGDTISILLPAGTVLNGLIPDIEVSAGASISPLSGIPQDFSGPVSYTVTAADGETTRVYTVNATVIAQSSAAEIIRFSLNGYPGVISGDTISVSVPSHINLENDYLIPAIEVSPGASVNPASEVPQLFDAENNPRTYTVTAADGKTRRSYKVYVNKAPSSAAEIISFRINGEEGHISGTNITVQLPASADLSKLLVPYIKVSPGASVGPLSGVGQDFSNSVNKPVPYVVTSQDGVTTQTYWVTVTNTPTSAAEILKFSVAGFNGVFNGLNILVQLPADIKVGVFAPQVSISAGATVSPVSQANVNFTDSVKHPVPYTVTARDGVTKRTYWVTVTNAAVNAADITSFTINGSTGTIQDTTINDQMSVGDPRRQRLSRLVFRNKPCNPDFIFCFIQLLEASGSVERYPMRKA
jgi:hypothetical protein